MIMHPGKAPYAMQDGEGIIENIIGGEFSYPFGKLKTGRVPKGPWRFCWSHLTYKIKEAFYETFWRDGMYHDEKNRGDAGFWLALFEEYLRLLENGTMSAQDEESVLIFPTRFKKDRNKTYAKCKLCGAEFDETLLEQGICRSCLRDGEKYQCSRCGGEMIYTNRQRYIEKIPRPEILPEMPCQKEQTLATSHVQKLRQDLRYNLRSKRIIRAKRLELADALRKLSRQADFVQK